MGKAVDATVVLSEVPDTSVIVVYAMRVTVVGSGDADEVVAVDGSSNHWIGPVPDHVVEDIDA